MERLNAEDGNVRRNALELPQRRAAIDGNVRSASRGDFQVATQYRRTLVYGDLLELHHLLPAMPQHPPSIVGPNVADPVGPFAEHRHQVPIAVEVSDHDGSVTTRPLRRPATSSAATRFGQIPAPYNIAETRFCIRANQCGRWPR
jgi:hypothetical protein